MRVWFFAAALACGLCFTGNTAVADNIAEVEPNNSGAGAQYIAPSSFSTEFVANISNSTTVPHVSIRATGDGTFDFYRFTLTGPGAITADMDATNFDTELFLWNGAGTLIAENDDNFAGDPGSTSFLDSLIVTGPLAAGDYVVGVGEFSSSGGSGFSLTGDVPDNGDFYTLHISAVNSVPEPASLAALGLGIAGVVVLRRRRRRA